MVLGTLAQEVFGKPIEYDLLLRATSNSYLQLGLAISFRKTCSSVFLALEFTQEANQHKTLETYKVLSKFELLHLKNNFLQVSQSIFSADLNLVNELTVFRLATHRQMDVEAQSVFRLCI